MNATPMIITVWLGIGIAGATIYALGFILWAVGWCLAHPKTAVHR